MKGKLLNYRLANEIELGVLASCVEEVESTSKNYEKECACP